ncbi:MAG TPA: DUF58 domain-containing protein [Phycisphaerales bacterium]|nr:DUF58 domain-containing protein [Phycisphaerales bacterium]
MSVPNLLAAADGNLAGPYVHHPPVYRSSVLASLGTPRPTTIEELLGPNLAARLDRMDILTRKMFAGKLPGERRSKRRGRSVEFDDFRDYIPGDDLRHIDWNVLARLDKLFIKLFREDEDLSVHLFVDSSLSMDSGEPSKLLFAHRLAMALAYVGLVKQNRVAVSCYTPHTRPMLRQLAAARGRPSAQRIGKFLLETLAARPEGGTVSSGDLNTALKTAAASRTGKGVMIVLSDFLVPEGYAAGLNALAAGGAGVAGFDTYCLQVVSQAELDPRKDSTRTLVGDLRLSDIETGRGVDVTLSAALLNRYRTRFASFTQDLRSACRARGIAHMQVMSDTPVDRFIMDTLRRGGLLR